MFRNSHEFLIPFIGYAIVYSAVLLVFVVADLLKKWGIS